MGGWFANRDWSQFIRKETINGRNEYVMLESENPGCITWFWSGMPSRKEAQKGIVRIYFNGNKTPDIEMTNEKFLNKSLCGNPLSIVLEIGRNLFLPISWKTSCKITFEHNYWETQEGKDKYWYMIYYREYPKDTEIEQFSLSNLKKYKQIIKQTNQILVEGWKNIKDQRNNPNNPPFSERKVIEGPIKLEVNSMLETNQIQGPSAISQIEILLNSSDSEDEILEEIGRKLLISINFDGITTVYTPIGDLFGAGLGIIPHKSWYSTITRIDHEDQNNNSTIGDKSTHTRSYKIQTRWIMPFKETCTIKLENLTGTVIEIKEISIITQPWIWDSDSMYFHSDWHQTRNVPTRPFSDFNFCDIENKGVLVGDLFTIFNTSGGWWGEGDAKVWVDGELQFHSTGTEDYYGFSFGDKGKFFESPTLIQTRWWGNNEIGYVCDTHNRILNRLVFNKRLKFDTEIWHWRDTIMDLAVSIKYYAINPKNITINKLEIQEEVKKEIMPPKATFLEKLKKLFKK
jgi:D-arabinan exo alpha-(1,3)/(1,5)-arabinofuranosidase (non-reducing end)